MDSLPPLSSLTTPSLLWEKHAARYEAVRAEEATRRAEAFLDDIPREVCGEHVRVMTPHDLLVLDGLENPFVAGGMASIQPEHIHQFLWLLSLDNYPGFFSELRFRKFQRRLCRRYILKGKIVPSALDALALEIDDYIRAVFEDSPVPKSRVEQQREAEGCRPQIGTHFLPVILVPLSMEVGLADPYNGRSWQLTPLPRIFQYLKVARARVDGRSYSDDSPHREIEAACLREINEARTAGILVGEFCGAPGDWVPGSRGLESITAEQVRAVHAGAALEQPEKV